MNQNQVKKYKQIIAASVSLYLKIRFVNSWVYLESQSSGGKEWLLKSFLSMKSSSGHSFSPSVWTLSFRRKLIVFSNILKLTFPVNFIVEEKQEIISLTGQNLFLF